MSGLDLNTMKLLLAEQSKTLISELKAQVITEVAEQLLPHTTRLDLLHDDQALLKKQISELSDKILKPSPIQVPAQPPPAPTTCIPSISSVPVPSPLYTVNSPSPADIASIESAKRTLEFSPITREDLERMKNNETEDVTIELLLERAFHDFLDTFMNIPTSTISRMKIKSIYHSQEVEFQKVTVEFDNICPVNTIFKYVKNLAPGQKVSIFIPEVLSARNDELQNLSFSPPKWPAQA